MDEITYDKVEDEKNPEVKQLYWNIAFGLQEVDGLKPSKYMIELSEEHINGKKTYNQVQEEITSYYKKNQPSLHFPYKITPYISVSAESSSLSLFVSTCFEPGVLLNGLS